MDLEMNTLSEISQRKINIIWYHLYVELNIKNDINELIYKIGMDSVFENKLMVTKGETGGGKG